MQYLVTQTPKAKFRGGYNTSFAIVEAKTAAEAIRIMLAKNDRDGFIIHPDFNKPAARPLVLEHVYNL